MSKPSQCFSSARALSAVANALIGASGSREELDEIVATLQQAITLANGAIVSRLSGQENEAVPLAAASAPKKKKRKELRVFLNGCFDIMHAGHYNALRQAKAAFRNEAEKVTLVVGVHSDEAIAAQKGPTVMDDAERIALVRGCKFVDEVVEKMPYLISVSLLDRLKCDFVVHGDDLPTCNDGTGLYSEVISAKRFRLIKRTEGTSTTTLIGRLLSMSKEHLMKPSGSPKLRPMAGDTADGQDGNAQLAALAMLLPTTSRLSQFLAGCKTSKSIGEAQKVVYVDGAFDMFHPGHLELLEKAKALGDFLIVGLHSDQTINTIRGVNFPVMSLHERAMCVMSCKYVDDVIYGAPLKVTQDLITTMNVSTVAVSARSSKKKLVSGGGDNYELPRSLGIVTELNIRSDLDTTAVIGRIIKNRTVFIERNKKKSKSEIAYLQKGKSFVAEA